MGLVDWEIRVRLVRIWRDSDGRVVGAEDPDPGLAADCRRFLRDREAFARAAAPVSDDDGIDIAGIDAWLTGKGLPVPPAVIMRLDAATAYREALAGAGYTFASFDAVLGLTHDHLQISGAYLHEIGMVLSRRIKDLHGYMHAHLVHEKAHAFTLPVIMTVESVGHHIGPDGHLIDDWDMQLPRVGLTMPTSGPQLGNFFEEGFATLMAAEYTRDALGLPDELWPDQMPLPTGMDGCSVPPLLATLPAGYVWKSTTPGVPVWSATAFAAAGIELLAQARPALYEALIRARRHVQGLRDVARIVEEIHPGLYSRLRRAPYSTEGFTAALRDIRTILT